MNNYIVLATEQIRAHLRHSNTLEPILTLGPDRVMVDGRCVAEGVITVVLGEKEAFQVLVNTVGSVWTLPDPLSPAWVERVREVK